ncbi:MAG TPA: hypothetical protein DCZ75_03170 [Geobacter sp.]|nr:hypothetical protein [Geobacter sp.]
MGDREKCENPERHKVHLCKLRKDGKDEELERYREKPIVICNKCKIQANDPRTLCNPRALKAGK